MRTNTAKRHVKAWTLRTMILMLAFGLLPAAATAEEKAAGQASAQLNQVYQLIEQFHVSGIDKDKLAEAAIKGMLETLDDPYSVYMNEKEWNEFNSSLEQNYVGIGVALVQEEDGYFINEVFPNSPAEQAGLLRGDYIVSVEGSEVAPGNIDAVVEKILGPEGTSVTVGFRRGSETFDKKMDRQRIQIPVVASRFFEGGVGYIQLTSFSHDADEKFAASLAELRSKDIRSLVVDLRGNPGGLLDTAANIASQFIQDGVLIHTKDRNNVDEEYTIKNGQSVPFPVYVLIDQNSASASEVLSGALQDYKLATLIGTKSYGKGSVQNIYNLSSGGVLKLTIEEYLTPNMRQVNKVGLTPDIEVDSSVPQLIAALKTAGLENVALKLRKRELELNGQVFGTAVNVLREDGRVYVPARVLAALTGSKVEWNDSVGAVELWKGGERQIFSPDGAMKLEQGTSYLDLETFRSLYPEVGYQADAEQVSISVAKES